MWDFRKAIPLVNIILLIIFAYYVMDFLEKRKELPYYEQLKFSMLLPIGLLAVAVLISVLLYWFNIGEKEK